MWLCHNKVVERLQAYFSRTAELTCISTLSFARLCYSASEAKHLGAPLCILSPCLRLTSLFVR